MAQSCSQDLATNLQTSQPVPPLWLARPAQEVAPDLVGCWLIRRTVMGQMWRGMIVETEAYGPGDPACHGYRKQTRRNQPMFGPPGLVYVYLIYGIYHCLNLVTEAEGVPSAVLIRAVSLAPETIQQLADSPHIAPSHQPERWAAGPGKLCRVFEIERHLSGQWLTPQTGLWLEPRSQHWQGDLVQTTRIGLTQGQDIPWRWYQQQHPAVSRP
ncbi:DNA-3-methyladenine glycosylase [Thermosynechococcaceae cyanobacterium BACA0444]|uniref:Putative 3-methyladenine DNA glycosylase n=1 Tax=Pseudocalidococcus azoricus BACA0444 TaxID=2918990 RepID=A0AAE4JW65_9CYAN|nr:DNA-3-methyladenine glycosylase [Pseudocalidococcus azoricus]MDS3859798.1 DNA-3-methyladenine glycosylase [Pseudocalidococcus azoricus BACA0444]